MTTRRVPDFYSLKAENDRLKREIRSLLFTYRAGASPKDGIPEELFEYQKHIREYFIVKIPPCVYFLIEDGRVVYVGKSSSLQGRITTHIEDKKSFTRVLYIECKTEEDALDLEAAFIHALKPSLNKHPGRRLFRQAQRILAAKRESEVVIRD